MEAAVHAEDNITELKRVTNSIARRARMCTED
jgi:hypothetical protein